MLLQILIALFLGICFGTITGLFPGIHINLVSAFLIALSSSILSAINPVYFIVFIASLAITHTFIDFIPSIFLGCPNADTELSILPGHELLKQGEGYQAIMRTAYGGLISIGNFGFSIFNRHCKTLSSYKKSNPLYPYFRLYFNDFFRKKKNFSGNCPYFNRTSWIMCS